MKLLLLFLACALCGQSPVVSTEKLHNLAYYELVDVLADVLDDVIRKDTETHPYKRRVQFSGHGRTFDVHLKRSNAIPEKLNVITQNHDDVGKSYHFRDHPVENCYYHGRVGDKDDAPVIASGSMCDEGFRGMLTDDGENFMIRPLEADDKVEAEKRKPGTHVIYNLKDVLNKEDIPKKDPSNAKVDEKNKKPKTDKTTKIYGRDDERWIEVIPVLTYEMFVNLERNISKAIQNVVSWVHDADALYTALEKKTRMVMVGLMIWDKYQEAYPGLGTMCAYVQKVMHNKLGLRFDTVPVLMNGGGWWGYSYLSTACGTRSATINSASTYSSIGLLIYHETLHALGMGEGEMGKTVIKDNFNRMIDENYFPCLYNRTAKDFTKNKCGNGLKEEGEVCDCVNEYQCKKRGEFECCDPKTCQLRPNKQCMHGGCCDKCMFKKKGASCVSTDQCLAQSPSTCSGTSGQCTASTPAMPAKRMGCYTLKYNDNRKSLRVLYDGSNRPHRYHPQWNEHMKGVLCQCARSAREQGREYFALTEWKKCYAVNKEDLVPNDKGENDAKMSDEVKDNGGPAVVKLKLMNPDQSSTHDHSRCSGAGTCAADKALDGDMTTSSVTFANSPSYWSAELSERSKIDDIRITTNSWAFGIGLFDRLKVLVREVDQPWRTCKGEFKMTKPFVNHVIKCDKPAAAKYVRVEVHGGVSLYLKEVEVRGYPFSGKIVHPPCNGKDDGCCTDLSPCGENDGDCDNFDQCKGKLVCGTDNCPRKSPFGYYDDCCMKGYCHLASDYNNKAPICNQANYRDNDTYTEVCSSGFAKMYFVYKVHIPDACPTTMSNRIGRQLPTKKGCYDFKEPSAASLLVNNNVYYTPWHQVPRWHVLIRELLCECAEAAKLRKAKFIAIQQSKCWMINENDLGVESDGKCFLADGWWTRKGHYQYKCDKTNLHSDTSYPCVGSLKLGGYFVYQLQD